MKFLIEINLGNDAMQTGEDVARALRAVAAQIDTDYAEWDRDADQGRVFDINGNSVGTWGVTA